MSSSLSSSLSSMEVMLDALMQRGIGKPEDLKPNDEVLPVLPTRPTVKGRLPSLQRPSTASPWVPRPPLPSIVPPTQEEEHEDISLVNLELERRAVKAEEEMKQKEEHMKLKEDEIAALRLQVEHYESRLTECEGRMKSVEDELRKQITSLQTTAGGIERGGSTATSQNREDMPPLSSAASRRADELSASGQRSSEPSTTAAAVGNEGLAVLNHLATEFQLQREVFEHGGVKSTVELKMLERQFGAWKKVYEGRLWKTKAELKKLSHVEKNHHQGHGNSQQQQRCGWCRVKIPKCRAPKCFKLSSPKSCSFCCCFRRCC